MTSSNLECYGANSFFSLTSIECRDYNNLRREVMVTILGKVGAIWCEASG